MKQSLHWILVVGWIAGTAFASTPPGMVLIPGGTFAMGSAFPGGPRGDPQTQPPASQTNHNIMKRNLITGSFSLLAASAALFCAFSTAHAADQASASATAGQGKKLPNIITIISDDFGWGDAGAYGGGEGRGMPTPSLDRMAKEGMTFFSFYGQPSCTPGLAAIRDGSSPMAGAISGTPSPKPWMSRRTAKSFTVRG